MLNYLVQLYLLRQNCKKLIFSPKSCKFCFGSSPVVTLHILCQKMYLVTLLTVDESVDERIWADFFYILTIIWILWQAADWQKYSKNDIIFFLQKLSNFWRQNRQIMKMDFDQNYGNHFWEEFFYPKKYQKLFLSSDFDPCEHTLE